MIYRQCSEVGRSIGWSKELLLVSQLGTLRDEISDEELIRIQLAPLATSEHVLRITRRLLLKFGDFRGVLTASTTDLFTIKGMTFEMAARLKTIEIAAMRLVRGRVSDRDVLSNLDAVVEYCQATMAQLDIELLRVFFLDANNGLLSDEIVAKGTVNHVPVYPREILKRAIELGALALILAHNHPSGDPTPSLADLEITKQLVDAGEILDVSIHDHIIVGAKGYYSMRQQALI